MKTETASKIFASVIDMTTPPMVKQAADDQTSLDWMKEQAKKLYGQGRDFASAHKQELTEGANNLAYGLTGGLLGDALVRGLGGRRNKVLRLLGLIGGGLAGQFAGAYVNNGGFRNEVNSGIKNLYNKITG